MKRTFAIETLGCKVNQCESSYLIELLINAGYSKVGFSEKADIYIVHGCAVTARASYETRQLLNRAHRINPDAMAYVVLGCAAQFEGEKLAQRGLVTHALGNMEKYEIVSFMRNAEALHDVPCIALSDPRKYDRMIPLENRSMLEDRSRAYLKIQDGCNAFCSYCIVPYLRGQSRSLPLQQVLEQMQRLLEQGFREVVLTGIHLGKWGHEFSLALVDLLRELSRKRVVPPRLRLSSLEPMECTNELLGFLETKEWFCHHFHIPLQSGSDKILKRMNRHYTIEFYNEIVHKVRHMFPNAAIGADVMVGFPGETDEDFKRTCNLIERLPLTYLHVFPFSPRAGTRCYEWSGDQVPRSVRKERARYLRQIARRKKLAFLESQVGKVLEVILERKEQSTWWRGTSRNYVSTRVQVGKDDEFLKGQQALVKVERIDAHNEIAEGSLIKLVI